MNKAVMISIQPKWCELITIEKKLIEVRKTRPSIETPFKCYIYETKSRTKYWSQPMPIPYTEGRGKVIGEFICDRIDEYNTSWLDGEDRLEHTTYLDDEEIMDYMNGYLDKKFYGWHISDLKIYDTPKELGEFERECFEDFYKGIGSKVCHKCDQYLMTTMYEPCDCKNGGYKPLTRPPQSWQFVEEV
ncbi:MAG: hypothetical protein NC037_00320 [Bacteroides sp.]|nr:hypothetical protein [Bacillota bacterium]MCM1393737.1 hypothetical protein [[Eubacterium] siraeum]MCM1454962.1 hypothetical protein [Bacteroides sp.]